MADPEEGPGGPSYPLFLDQTGAKRFFWRHPPPSRPLISRHCEVIRYITFRSFASLSVGVFYRVGSRQRSY